MSHSIAYDKACLALTLAVSTDEVMAIRKRALFSKFLAEATGIRKAAIEAAEVVIRAERRLGQLLTTRPASNE